MIVYNYTDVCQSLTKMLDDAKNNENVYIRSENGELFIIKLASAKGAEYNLPDLDLDLSREEIVNYVRESRER